MSRITILIETYQDKMGLLKKLKSVTGESLGSLGKSIDSGEPIIEIELFDNQFPEKASMLKQFLSSISEEEAVLKIFELPEGVEFATYSAKESAQISREILENIIESAEGTIDLLPPIT